MILVDSDSFYLYFLLISISILTGVTVLQLAPDINCACKKREMTINTILVDPGYETRQLLRKTIQDHQEFKIKGAAWDAHDAKQVIEKVSPDLLFLNADLPDQSGFSLLDTLAEDKRPQIVIMSTKESYAMQALQYSALDFLKLPLDSAQINRTLKKIIDIRKLATRSDEKAKNETGSLSNGEKRFAIKSGSKVVFIDIEEIEYICGSGYYIEFNTRDRKYLMRESMSNVINMLPSNRFKRIHRSTIVNKSFIEEIIRKGPKAFYVRTRSGEERRISSSYKKELFEDLMP